jgi:hypothetical protein
MNKQSLIRCCRSQVDTCLAADANVKFSTMSRDQGSLDVMHLPSITDKALHKLSQLQHVNPIFVFQRF